MYYWHIGSWPYKMVMDLPRVVTSLPQPCSVEPEDSVSLAHHGMMISVWECAQLLEFLNESAASVTVFSHAGRVHRGHTHRTVPVTVIKMNPSAKKQKLLIRLLRIFHNKWLAVGAVPLQSPRPVCNSSLPSSCHKAYKVIDKPTGTTWCSAALYHSRVNCLEKCWFKTTESGGASFTMSYRRCMMSRLNC